TLLRSIKKLVSPSLTSPCTSVQSWSGPSPGSNLPDTFMTLTEFASRLTSFKGRFIISRILSAYDSSQIYHFAEQIGRFFPHAARYRPFVIDNPPGVIVDVWWRTRAYRGPVIHLTTMNVA